ncbi:acyltransferase family protein [Leucobacter sp. M11]|uniref:acyltransferase family protein n=1 Tax=Leucobacter sp. M11 TaxID=2993565 RepID=UPI002D8054EC|nr:acyltransferase family protein [Leucobacter sp. M11]MEB4615259.1 acyltransferase family protein [Leucobacter sp. M11]
MSPAVLDGKSPAQAPGNRTSGGKPRIALWDNAHFFLIVLVVIGHTLSTVRTDSGLAFSIYSYIYLFHMPAMLLISGYFAKTQVTPKATRGVLKLVATWMFFEGIWALVRFLTNGKTLSDEFLVAPAWTLWFLVTLATMKILLPYIARLRAPLTVSVVLALAAGLSPAIGVDFSASRTLCFLPFFVAGWLVKERGWLSGEWFRRPSVGLRSAAAAVLLAVAAAFVVFPDLRGEARIDRWLTWRDDYDTLLDLGEVATPVAGILIRFALLATATLMTAALLVLVPRGHSRITVWGTRTLYVYLLHGFLVFALRNSGAIDAIDSLGVPGTLILVAIATAIAVLLSSAPVARLTRPLIEPKFKAIFSRT